MKSRHGVACGSRGGASRLSRTSPKGNTARELGFSEETIEALGHLGHALNAPGETGPVLADVIDRRGRLSTTPPSVAASITARSLIATAATP